jgi:hypothetical protein
MGKRSEQPKKNCSTYEVIQRDENGDHAITPFSDALAASGVLAKQAVTKMRMLHEISWPEARDALKDDQGHRLIVSKDDRIWLLKCKPSCWRLYFYVSENATTTRIVYVHAVCKKRNRENPSDATHARSIVDTIRPGGSGISAFEFPLD